MFGSWKIATALGVPIRVHASVVFLLVLAMLWSRSLDVPAIMIAAFFCITLHELGHTAVALAKGCRVRQIMLLPTGGAAMMENMPERPRDELLMALAGPLVSLLLGLVLMLTLPLLASWPLFHFYVRLLGHLNLLWAAFNLAPAFPMDGGRVLRALLTPRLGRLRATYLASRIGKALAVLFGLWAYLAPHGPLFFSIAIAFLIFISAENEYRCVRHEESAKQFASSWSNIFSMHNASGHGDSGSAFDPERTRPVRPFWVSPPPYRDRASTGEPPAKG